MEKIWEQGPDQRHMEKKTFRSSDCIGCIASTECEVSLYWTLTTTLYNEWTYDINLPPLVELKLQQTSNNLRRHNFEQMDGQNNVRINN